jgi:hypothetical protein
VKNLLLIGLVLSALGGCASISGKSDYSDDTPTPTDLSSVRYMYAFSTKNEFVQTAYMGPSTLAQQLRQRQRQRPVAVEDDFDDEDNSF